MIKKISSIILPALLLLFTSGAISQVTISGPLCLVPDVVYQFKITSAWDSASVMQICVNGGSIADSSISRNCSDTSAPLAAVLIVWNDLSNASLTVNSSKGNKTFAVNITSPLQPGSLDSASRVQTIYDTTTTPATIYCAVDSGGSCTPGYAYQWQRSADALVWTDVSGATGQNLSFTDEVKKTCITDAG